MNPTLFPIRVALASDQAALVGSGPSACLGAKPELARLPGVAEVVVQGGRRLEARVTLDPAALRRGGLDAAAVADRSATGRGRSKSSVCSR